MSAGFGMDIDEDDTFMSTNFSLDVDDDDLPTTLTQKGATLARNDAKWELLKDEIYRIYMVESNTLSATMALIEQIHQFRASPRKWKDKLKEWGFDKNIKVTEKEMQFIVSKADRRSTEKGKATAFLYKQERMIPPAKIETWKRKINRTKSALANPSLSTPSTIAYFTPVSPPRHTAQQLQATAVPISISSVTTESSDTYDMSIYSTTYRTVTKLANYDASFDLTPKAQEFPVPDLGPIRLPWNGTLNNPSDSFFDVLSEDKLTTEKTVQVSLAPGKVLDPITLRAIWEALVSPVWDMEDKLSSYQYCSLKCTRNGVTYRFRPQFICGLFLPLNDECFHILGEAMKAEWCDSMLKREDPTLEGLFSNSWTLALCWALGEAMVKNTDLLRATAVANVVDRVLSEYDKYNHRVTGSPDLILGCWHYDNGLVKESVPLFQDAFLFSLRKLLCEGLTPKWPYINSLFGTLTESYQKLGSESDCLEANMRMFWAGSG
ncbi:hypothetical protein EG329_007373 [Mollisiaceae sp. DMI_Dod_QoI]|nr:hypothetical protein EG329_007373 [Helotiales sp. DMI_Dod_QoI]